MTSQGRKQAAFKTSKPKTHKAIDWEEIGRNDLREVAYHEAGHAIVCNHFRIPWCLSRFEQTTATMDTLGANAQLSYIRGDWTTPFRLAAVGWAGVMAALLLDGEDEYICYEVYTEFEELSPSDRTLVEGTLFRWRALTTAARILRRRWADVERTASDFLERKNFDEMTTILLLEDNADRITAFQSAVAKIPDARLVVWKDAHAMIRDLPQHLDGASLISLDHDLVAQDGSGGDPGTGLNVCEALAKHAPVCPVVLHSTNYERVLTMTRTLEDAGWTTVRVAPVGMGEEWIGTSWLPRTREVLCPVDESRIINLSSKPTKSQEKFNRRIRNERGNKCEVCGKTDAEIQIEAHHILDRRAFPQHAKNPENILVLCQPCHSALTDCTGDLIPKDLLGYASLPASIRQRIATFLESSQPTLTTFVQALRRGRGYANAVFWWRMEHKSLHPPEAFVRRHIEHEVAYEAFLKEEASKITPKPSAVSGTTRL